jgi:hypothetical protein
VEAPGLPPCAHAQCTRGTPCAPCGPRGNLTHAEKNSTPKIIFACVEAPGLPPCAHAQCTRGTPCAPCGPRGTLTHAEKNYTPKIIFACVEDPHVPPCGHAQRTRGTPRAPWGEVSPLTHAEKILSPLWRFACVALTGTGPRCAYPPSVCGYFILWAQLLVAHTRRDNTLAQRTESATAVCVPLNFPKPSRQ